MRHRPMQMDPLHFSPESSMLTDLIGQVFWLEPFADSFPLHAQQWIGKHCLRWPALKIFLREPKLQRKCNRAGGVITATGIAPDLHRTSLLIPRNAET